MDVKSRHFFQKTVFFCASSYVSISKKICECPEFSVARISCKFRTKYYLTLQCVTETAKEEKKAQIITFEK